MAHLAKVFDVSPRFPFGKLPDFLPNCVDELGLFLALGQLIVGLGVVRENCHVFVARPSHGWEKRNGGGKSTIIT
jgi:hypothetical protein